MEGLPPPVAAVAPEADPVVEPIMGEVEDLMSRLMAASDERHFDQMGRLLAHQTPNLFGMPRLRSRNYLDYLDFRKKMCAYLTLSGVNENRASIVVLHAMDGDAFDVVRECFDELCGLDIDALWVRLDAAFGTGEGPLETLPLLIGLAQKPNESVDEFLMRFRRNFSVVAPKLPSEYEGESLEECKHRLRALRSRYSEVVDGLEVGLFVRSIRPEMRQVAIAASPFDMSSIVKILRRSETLHVASNVQPRVNAGDGFGRGNLVSTMPRGGRPFGAGVGGFRTPASNVRAFYPRARSASVPRWNANARPWRPAEPWRQFGPRQQFVPQIAMEQMGQVRQDQPAEGGRGLRPRCPQCGGAKHDGRPCPPTVFAVDGPVWNAAFATTDVEQTSTQTVVPPRECFAMGTRINTLMFATLLILAGLGDVSADHTVFSNLDTPKLAYPLSLCHQGEGSKLFRLFSKCTPCREPQWRLDKGRMDDAALRRLLLNQAARTRHFMAVIRAASPVELRSTACWCRRRRTDCAFSETFFAAKTKECVDTLLPVSVSECQVMCDGHITEDGPLRPLSTTHFATNNVIKEEFNWLSTSRLNVVNSECIRTHVTAELYNGTVHAGVVTKGCPFSQGHCETLPIGRLLWDRRQEHGEDTCPYPAVTETRCYELALAPNGYRTLRCGAGTMDFVIIKYLEPFNSPCPGIELHHTAQGAYLQLFSLSVGRNDTLQFTNESDARIVAAIRKQNWASMSNLEMLTEAQLQRTEDENVEFDHYFDCRMQEMRCQMLRRFSAVFQAIELLLPGSSTFALREDAHVTLAGEFAQITQCINITEYEVLELSDCFRQPAIRYRFHGQVVHGFIGPGKIIMQSGTPCVHAHPVFIEFGNDVLEMRSRRVVVKNVYDLDVAHAFHMANPVVFRAHPKLTAEDMYVAATELIVEQSILDVPTQATQVPSLRAASRSKVPAFLDDLADGISAPLKALRHQIILGVSAFVLVVVVLVIWCYVLPCARRFKQRYSRSRGTETDSRVNSDDVRNLSLPTARRNLGDSVVHAQPLARNFDSVPPPSYGSGLYPALERRLRQKV